MLDERALHLHALALSVLRSTGTSVAVGFAIVTVYRRGALTLRYWPKHGLLDVWHGKKVLMISRSDGKPVVLLYESGMWERDLEVEASGVQKLHRCPRLMLRPDDVGSTEGPGLRRLIRTGRGSGKVDRSLPASCFDGLH